MNFTGHSVGLACGLSLLASVAQGAENFPRTDAHQVRSLSSGMAVPSVPILTRISNGTVTATASTLLAAVCSNCGPTKTEVRSDRSRIAGASWHLDIFGADGSAAEYSDDAATDRQEAVASAHPKAIAAAELDRAGKAFINSKLSGAIKLQAGESIVPEAVYYLTAHGGSADGKVVAEPRVIANRIQFTREINGIPVVGPGSKVTITFLNDGTLESFRYDWPAYAPTGRSQDTIPVGDVLQRVQRVVGVRSNGVALQPAIVPAVVTVGTQVDLGADTRLTKLACGYYDAGFTNRSSAPLQSACYYHATHVMNAGGHVMTAGYAGAIPAATSPERDDAWAEESFFRGTSVTLPPPPPSAAVPSAASRPAASSKP